MQKDLAIKEPAQMTVADSSPVGIMQMALSQGADLTQLEKMMDLQTRWESNEARKAYHQAMANFKANPPKIKKDKIVGYQDKKGNVVGYTHASLGNVTAKINAALGEHGLTASWKTEQANNIITVTCSITHKMGHSESTALSSPPDNSGKKNSIQAMGSAISYLQRYTLLSLTGLATHDQDDDAQQATVQYIDEKQQASVADAMIAAKVDQADYLKYLKVESIGAIPAAWYPQVMNELKVIMAKKDGDK